MDEASNFHFTDDEEEFFPRIPEVDSELLPVIIDHGHGFRDHQVDASRDQLASPRQLRASFGDPLKRSRVLRKDDSPHSAPQFLKNQKPASQKIVERVMIFFILFFLFYYQIYYNSVELLK